MIRFDDQVAIVTGAGSGLGRSHAMLLASRGAKVVVNDPGGSLDGKAGDDSAADKVVAEIISAGGRAVANYASVADREGAASIVNTALETFGSLHIVVNNAGILRDRSFLKMSLDDFEAVVKVHLNGTVNVTHAAWPHLLAQGYGRIVFTTSGSGLVGSFGQSNYGAAKTAMLGLMNNLKFEARSADIKINMISPIAATRMTERIFDQRQFELSLPERVSPAVAWLCARECDFTGETIAAGAGYFTRVRMVKAKGYISDTSTIPTIEDLISQREQIFDLSDADLYTVTLDGETKKLLGLQ